MKCRDCKKEVENVEMTCGAETDFEFVPLCEYCQEKRYTRHYGIEKPKDDASEDGGDLCG